MNIVFYTNQICERGTEVALFGYAKGNENVLKNHSFVIVPKDKIYDADMLNKFQSNFTTCLYESKSQINDFIASNKIDLIYKITDGETEEEVYNKIPHFLHCVFSTKNRQGTFYCPISQFINKWYGTDYPVLPHIIKKFPGNSRSLRETLGIPIDAVVFGGYGGQMQFNIPFVHDVIVETVQRSKNIYFLFMNFKPFANNDRIIFLEKSTNIEYKEMFINTCDAMIHARKDGETFGLAVAEFSVKNKPVITWDPFKSIAGNVKFRLRSMKRYLSKNQYLYARAHLDFLGKKAILYQSEKDLLKILLNFNTLPENSAGINYDCYSERFSEERVMRQFEAIISK